MRTHTRGAPTAFFLSLLWPLLSSVVAVVVAAAVEVDPGRGIPFMGGNYNGHPMLYFSRGDVEEMQYAATGTHRDMARRIREAGETMLEHPEEYLPPWSPAEFSARWNEVYGNNLGVLSMFCLLYPHRAGAVDLAKDYMERMAAQPSWYIFYLFITTSILTLWDLKVSKIQSCSTKGRPINGLLISLSLLIWSKQLDTDR